MTFEMNKSICLKDINEKQKEFIEKINQENKILVIDEDKPCFIALNLDFCQSLIEEIEELRDYQLLHKRLEELNKTDINSLKTIDNLKEEGIL